MDILWYSVLVVWILMATYRIYAIERKTDKLGFYVALLMHSMQKVKPSLRPTLAKINKKDSHIQKVKERDGTVVRENLYKEISGMANLRYKVIKGHEIRSEQIKSVIWATAIILEEVNKKSKIDPIINKIKSCGEDDGT